MLAAIPISASIESLNAGVAAGIALYEISRQRGSSTHPAAGRWVIVSMPGGARRP